jgi:hypothetical protein
MKTVSSGINKRKSIKIAKVGPRQNAINPRYVLGVLKAPVLSAASVNNLGDYKTVHQLQEYFSLRKAMDW